ncbi:MAG: PAS domain-containing protein [Acidobacteria bacterium]|nr:PAS domain-containing protein [Acidobacteriota bacterium]
MGSPVLHLVHVSLRKLFMVPVVLAGIWFGLRGGALAAAATTAVYLPFVAERWSGQTLENLNQLGEVFSLWVIGLVVGGLAGRQRWTLEAAAEASHLARERLEAVVDAAGVGMMLATSGPTLRWLSGRAAEWLAWSQPGPDALCPLVEPGEGRCETCVVREVFATGRATTAERRRTVPGGSSRYFRHTATPLRTSSGEVIQVVEVLEDITGRKALEEEAIRSGKLSVLGRLAAGMAHEIGNPLASMSTRLRLLERRAGDAEFQAQSVQVLRNQIDRISRILRGISQFGKVRRDRALWSIRELVEETVGMVELDPRAADIRFDIEVERVSIHAVRDQVGQILLNLLLNAVESMSGAGRVRVRTEQAGGELRLSVEDEGPGIDDSAREHLFEPFYSTKDHGTGLGLSISSGFASAHGGRIEAENRAEGGACFVLVLPTGGVP